MSEQKSIDIKLTIDNIPIPSVIYDKDTLEIISVNSLFNNLYPSPSSRIKGITDIICDIPPANGTINTRDYDGDEIIVTTKSCDSIILAVFKEKDSINEHVSKYLEQAEEHIVNGISLLSDSKLTLSQFEALKSLRLGIYTILHLKNGIRSIDKISIGKPAIDTQGKQVFHFKALIDNIEKIVMSRYNITIEHQISFSVPTMVCGDKESIIYIIVSLLNKLASLNKNHSDNTITISVNTKLRKQQQLENKMIGYSDIHSSKKTKTLVITLQCHKHNTLAIHTNEIDERILENIIDNVNGKISSDESDGMVKKILYIPVENVDNINIHRKFFSNLFKGKSILLIDENSDSRAYTLRLLTKWGIQVSSATNKIESDVIFKMLNKSNSNIIACLTTNMTNLPECYNNSQEHKNETLLPPVVTLGGEGKDTLTIPIAIDRPRSGTRGGKNIKPFIPVANISMPLKEDAVLTVLSHIVSDRDSILKPTTTCIVDDVQHYHDEISSILITTGKHNIISAYTSDEIINIAKRHQYEHLVIFIDVYIENIFVLLSTLRGILKLEPYIVLLTTRDTNRSFLKPLLKKQLANRNICKPLKKKDVINVMKFNEN